MADLEPARRRVEGGGYWLIGGEGPPPLQTTLLLHHRSGVDEFVLDVATRLAERGHRVAIPELYGEPLPEGDPEEAKRRLADERVIELIRAVVDAVDVKGGRAPSVMGHCMGGRFAFLAAVADCGIDRASCFYGGEIDRPWHAAVSPIERVKADVAHVQMIRGSRDSNATAEQVEAAVAAFDAVGGKLEATTYTGARHAFANHRDPKRFNPLCAARAWSAALTFLEHDDGAQP